MVEEEPMNEKKRREAWMDIEKNLLDDDLVPIVPVQEWRGLTLLVENLVNSEICSTNERGRIVAALSPEVEVVMLFEEMLRRRIDYLSMLGLDRPDPDPIVKIDCHLDIWIRRRSDNEHGDKWSRKVCILAPNAATLPVTDLAATFVLWAEAGFPDPPQNMGPQVELIRTSENYEDFQFRVSEEDRIRGELALREAERARRSRRRIREQIEFQERRKREIEVAEKEISSMGWRELIDAVQQKKPLLSAENDRIEEHKRIRAHQILTSSG